MKFEYLATKDQKTAGLQFRESLDENAVLVFFDVNKNDVFVSQNCRFPFDIAFLGKHNTIISMKTILPPKDSIKAPLGTVMALEANKGCLTNRYEIGKRFYITKEK